MNEAAQDNLKFDEEEAIAFIRKYVPESVGEQYSDDEILFVVDTVWDYYESKGVVSLRKKLADNEDKDISDLVSYVRKEIGRDGELMMNPDDIKHIVEGELAYEESIELFDN